MDSERAEQGLPLDIEALPCGVCRLRMDDGLSVAASNRRFYQFFGYEEGELVQYGPAVLRFFIYPADWPGFLSGVQDAALAGKASFQIEARAIHRSGRVLWMLLCCAPGEQNCLDCIVLDVSERVQTIERLKLGEEERQLLLTHTGRFAFRFYLTSRTAVLPPDTARELGMGERMELFPEHVLRGGWCADESREDFSRLFRSILDGGQAGSALLRFRNGAGDFTWYSFAYSMVCSREGRPLHAVVSFEDVSRQRERELAYEKWSQYSRTQLENAVVYYECNLTRNLLEKLDGYTDFYYPPEAVRSYDEVLAYVVEEMVWPEDRELTRTRFQRSLLLEHYRQGGRELSLECRRVDGGGAPSWVQVNVQILSDPFSDDIKVFVLVRDINEEKLRQEDLRNRSQTDPLTGLLNRSAFAEQLAALFSSAPSGAHHALVMLDLDRFKALNDTMGHQFGDKVLTDLADVLRNALRSDDLIGRLGGDEFVLLLKNMPSRRALADKMANICGQLTLTVTCGAHISGSLGGALFPEDGTEFAELYRKADLALYRAKSMGRGRYALFDGETMK